MGAAMDELVMLRGILDSLPYPVVFVDSSFIIRYMNRYAQYHYYQERGYRDLIGKSIFSCHNKESSRERIRTVFEKMKLDGKEMFVGVNARNQRLYMQPVRDGEGRLIGFFERFEMNLRIEQSL